MNAHTVMIANKDTVAKTVVQQRANQMAGAKNPSQKASTITLNKLASEGRGGALSKSITVNQNRKQIIQSLGRYNDIMSHENFEQEFETVNNDALALV